MTFRTAAFILAALLCTQNAGAQTSRSRSVGTKVLWTVIGAAAGTAVGAYSAWDDDERAAVLQDRMRRRMIIGGSIGGAMGFWLGHYRSRRSFHPEIRPETRADFRVRTAIWRLSETSSACQQSYEDPGVPRGEVGGEHDRADGDRSRAPGADGMDAQSHPAAEGNVPRHTPVKVARTSPYDRLRKRLGFPRDRPANAIRGEANVCA